MQTHLETLADPLFWFTEVVGQEWDEQAAQGIETLDAIKNAIGTVVSEDPILCHKFCEGAAQFLETSPDASPDAKTLCQRHPKLFTEPSEQSKKTHITVLSGAVLEVVADLRNLADFLDGNKPRH